MKNFGQVPFNYFLKGTAIFALLALHLVCSMPVSAQYMHAKGTKIIDKDGKAIILRGIGLGGWMVQEGYMMETSDFANSQYQIKAKIEEVLGTENTAEFYEAWLKNHCTKKDIESLATWGFNSVRLPMHYNLYTLPIEQEPVRGVNTWLDKGFALTDSLLKWCKQNQIYLILDLHAAPGGQGRDAAISDYNPARKSLWEDDFNKSKTVALWRKLADRYKNEQWIGGYDLINEINWNFTPGANPNGCDELTNAPLKQLYQSIITAIRDVDQNHSVFIEGNCWGNNHNGLHTPKLDNNMVISFHKYWNYNDQTSIQDVINLRNSVNVPLWLGESGENSNTWFTNAIKLVEGNDIGWAWWPLKKVSSVVNPLTVVKNEGYTNLLNYWKNGGTKPSMATAKASLMQLADNLKIENCIYRKDVIDAMIRQVYDNTSIPFNINKVPGVIHASDFDLGKYNVAYKDTDTATYHTITRVYTAWNNGWSYRNDGVDIQTNTDTDVNSNHHHVGFTKDGEWLKYTLDVDSSAGYDVTVRYSLGTSTITLNVNGSDLVSTTSLPAVGALADKLIPNVVLYKGAHGLKLIFEKGGANIHYLKFTLSKKINEIAFQAISANTATIEQPKLYISLNKKIDASTLTGIGSFSATVKGTTTPISQVVVHSQNAAMLIVTLRDSFYENDAIKISYNGSQLLSIDKTPLAAFTLDAKNNLPKYILIPTKIEAEAFDVNQGLATEPTTDTGGGLDMGFTDTNDYLDYKINVATTSEYSIESRIASNSGGGKILIQQLDELGGILNFVEVIVPITGGWQTWRTLSNRITLSAGRGTLRVKVVHSGFNINWFKFDIISSVSKEKQGLIIYPNPTDDHLIIEVPGNLYVKENYLSIRNTNGVIVKQGKELSKEDINGYSVKELAAGIYFLELGLGDKIWIQKFVIK